MIGDFNAQKANSFVKDFCDTDSFKYIVKEPACYNDPLNPKCINLLSEHNLSDLHKMTVTVLKCYF